MFKKYLTIDFLRQAGLKYQYGGYVLQTTGNKVYKDKNGYFIKVKTIAEVK